MKVLVVGGGGREHALCWALSGSSLLTKLWCAPGNAGIAEVAECVAVGAEDVPALRLGGRNPFPREVAEAPGVPGARWRRFDDPAAARAYIRGQGAPIVVK